MEYYQTLCSSGLGFVSKQQREIDQQRNDLLDTKRKLVYSNFDSLIKFSEFSADLDHDFQKIEDSLNDLKNTIPEFNKECETFAKTSQEISSHWNDVSSMLAKYPQMIEFLEIPQLLNNCIRSMYYDDALKIYKFVSTLCQRNRSVSPIFDNILMEVKKIQDVMVGQILREMGTNLQLPACMSLIDYLRKTDNFSEEQLRIRFLLARDQHFESSLQKIVSNNVPNISSIMKVTETFRINIFDIVTQYRALFPDLDYDSTIVSDLSKDSESEYSNSKIISSWLFLKIESYMKILNDCLDASLFSKMNLPVESIMENCFYFGLSMSKISADIRPQIDYAFRKFIHSRFVHRIELANDRFDRSIPKLCKMYRQKKMGIANDTVLTYKHFLILQNYESDILEIFNEIKNIVPVALFASFKSILEKSLKSLIDSLNKYVIEHEFSLKKEEFQVFQNVFRLCQQELLPKIATNFGQICPGTVVSKRLTITGAQLRQHCDVNFELDINEICDRIRTVMETNSNKC